MRGLRVLLLLLLCGSVVGGAEIANDDVETNHRGDRAQEEDVEAIAGANEALPDAQREPSLVTLDIQTGAYTGEVTYDDVNNKGNADDQANGNADGHGATTSSDSQIPERFPSTPVEQEAFVARMEDTLDALLRRLEAQGMVVLSGDADGELRELREIMEQAGSMLNGESMQELPSLYEKLMDAQALEEHVLDHSELDAALNSKAGDGETTAEDASRDSAAALLPPLEPTEAFLDIEDVLLTHGTSQEIIAQLQTLVREEDDAFAHEKLALIELFEEVPGDTTPRNLSRALAHLQVAADNQLSTAVATRALLDLLDFGVVLGNVSSEALTRQRHADAEDVLMDMAQVDQDFVASLVVGYRMLTGQLTGIWTDDRCLNALTYYQRCAKSNVQHSGRNGGGAAFSSEPAVVLAEEAVMNGGNGESGATEELAEEATQRFEYFRSLATANGGDEQWAEAQQRLGEAYYYGDAAAGVPRDQARAADHFRQAAAAGEPVAQANYGMMLANGIGVKQDNKSAMAFYELAAAQGQGFAMAGIGVLHLTGAGVPVNATKAVEYFILATKSGYMEAHTYLGDALLTGNGAVKNESLALQHFQVAAEAGSSAAKLRLGGMYQLGVGAPMSCDRALAYYREVAVDPGMLMDMPFSMDRAYAFYQRGDYLAAYLQYRLVGELGVADAQVNAAYILDHHSDAIYTPDSSSQEKEESSPSSLWSVVDKNDMPRQPRAEVFALYDQASWLNHSEAIRQVGACFHDSWNGICDQNHTRAKEEYARAATLGDAQAAYQCGVMHTIGDGVEFDLLEAQRYYAMCSRAPFPSNAPCVLAQTAVEVALTLHRIVSALQIWN